MRKEDKVGMEASRCEKVKEGRVGQRGEHTLSFICGCV